MDAIAKEQWALALLTARFDCAQQKFFQAEYGRRRRSPAVALALCLTLGAFGAHEFYLGRLRSGALRLLFCWTLIPLLLALIEASFLTRRTHAYNARMAHMLADIVTETFAAVREQDRAEERAQAAGQGGERAGEQAAWQVGAARTFEPPEGALQRQEAGPTMPLAEEREAPVSPPSAPARPDATRAAPVTIPLGEPAPLYPATLARPMRARLDPSLDALLAELTATGESAPQSVATSHIAPHADPAPASAPAPVAEAPALVAGAPAPLAPMEQPERADAPEQPEQPELSAPSEPAAVSAAPEEPVAQEEAQDYAKMMATDEPLTGIMGAEPASGPAPAPPRVQRIVVRKVALVDGRPIAEAQATRDVVIRGSDDEAEAQIAAATDEARAEAMSLLAAMVPSETLAQAQGL